MTLILGDLIKQYRREHSCSMDQFSKLSGLSKAYISILERNVNPVNGKPVIPSLETIKAVSQAIGMDFNDVIAILDGDQPVSLKPESSSATSPRNPAQDTLISLFQQLNEDGQNKVIDYAKDLVSTGHYSLGVWWGNQCIPSKEIPAEYFDSLGDTVRETLKNDADSKLSKGAENAKWSVIYSPDISTTHANDESGDINACAVLFDASSTNDNSKPELSTTPPTKAKTK